MFRDLHSVELVGGLILLRAFFRREPCPLATISLCRLANEISFFLIASAVAAEAKRESHETQHEKACVCVMYFLVGPWGMGSYTHNN